MTETYLLYILLVVSVELFADKMGVELDDPILAVENWIITIKYVTLVERNDEYNPWLSWKNPAAVNFGGKFL